MGTILQTFFHEPFHMGPILQTFFTSVYKFEVVEKKECPQLNGIESVSYH